MIALNNILVATDFGEQSEAALTYGRDLARTFGATLHVLHVVENIAVRFANEASSTVLPELQPQLDGKQLRIRGRSLFAAVHGIVSLSLERRFVGIAEADLANEINQFVGTMVAGLKERQ